jgi:translation initiation factor 2 subunit 3
MKLVHCDAHLSKVELYHCWLKTTRSFMPGGLIGVSLLVDPSITRNDRLVGNVLGSPGLLPDIYIEVDIKFHRIIFSRFLSAMNPVLM